MSVLAVLTVLKLVALWLLLLFKVDEYFMPQLVCLFIAFIYYLSASALKAVLVQLYCLTDAVQKEMGGDGRGKIELIPKFGYVMLHSCCYES